MYLSPIKGGENSECVFKNAKHHLTDTDFQKVYGGAPFMFRSQDEAEKFAGEQKHESWVTKIVNYLASDVEMGKDGHLGKAKPGAVKYTVGWLVSIAVKRRVK